LTVQCASVQKVKTPVKELLLRSRKIKLSTNKPSKRRREHDVGVQNNFCFATVLDDNKRSFLNK